MKVLVTGGAGFIGSHACKALAAAGHEPIVYDNLSVGSAEAVRWGPLEVGDVLDDERLTTVLKRHAPDLVMHFAALAYVGDSMARPMDYYRVNVTGTCDLLSAMLRTGVRRFVLASSCATYGLPQQLPITEAQVQRPINPYGFTKLVAERMLSDLQRSEDLHWASLRYFNAAGADPDGELGENHEPETHLIPLAIRAALGLGPALEIFGDDYPTADGSAVRDYVHVSDLADAHVLAADYLADGREPRSFNLGSGRGTSVREIVAAVSAVVGRDVPSKVSPRRAGDPPALYASQDLAREELGWRPSLSSTRRIVETAATWIGRAGAAAPVRPDAALWSAREHEAMSGGRARRALAASSQPQP